MKTQLEYPIINIFIVDSRSRDVTNEIIGRVNCNPSSPFVGQSVLVDVLSPSDIPYNNIDSPYISINGITGSKQYLQFRSPGRYMITILAIKNDKREISQINGTSNLFRLIATVNGLIVIRSSGL